MSQSIVPVSQIRNLPEVQREHAVTSYLVQARDRLADALTATGPEAVASIKAEVSTIAEMTKQLGLSKENRAMAEEMVRRSEWSLDIAVRKAQESGELATPGVTHRRPGDADLNANSMRTRDFFSHATERSQAHQMGEATEEEFEDALTEARAEGNLSRANVVRKIKGQKNGQRTRQQFAEQVADLANEGYSSDQIAKKLDVAEDYVRRVAREDGITVHADAVRARRRRIDSNRVLSNVAESVEAAAFSIRQIEKADLNEDEALEWVDSLTDSLNALRREVKKIKESFHVQG